MSVFVLLDILLLILIALFVPIGFWRGAQREAMVTLGILFGAVLAEWWAEPWGADLAELTRLRESGGAFMVAVLFLIGGTFLLGYAAGAALPVPPPGLASRLFGALIAAGNGALLLSFALRDIRVFLLSSENSGFFDQAVVAQFLSTGVGWLLLGAAVIFTPTVLALALFGRRTVVVADYGDADSDFVHDFTPSPRSRPPRGSVPAEHTAQPPYKAEAPRSSRGQVATEETRPAFVVAETPRRAERDPATGETQIIRRASPTRQANDQQTDEMPVVTPTSAASPVADSSVTCPNCHADIREADAYCPRCGQVL